MKHINDQQLENIYDQLQEIVEIVCKNCMAIDQTEKGESGEECIELYEKGWRATSRHAYCKACIDKNPSLLTQ